MAIMQTLSIPTTTTNILFPSKTLVTKTHSLSLNLKLINNNITLLVTKSSSLNTNNNNNNKTLLLTKSSSLDYYNTNTFNNNNNNNNNDNSNDGFYGSDTKYPRPEEIEWKKELCNSVQLIGIVASPVQLKELPSGKAVAWSRLAVKKSSTDTAWINLTFWDELAHVSSQHVEKGNQIYVSGRLVSDTVESEDGKQQTYYKVVVQQLNFIKRGFSSVPLYDGEPSSETTGRKNYAVNTTGSTEELWQAFFANPVDWWDNRQNKRNPKAPDFKHKDTGEALWIEGRYNPSWVKSQLEILDSRIEAFNQQKEGRNSNFYSSY